MAGGRAVPRAPGAAVQDRHAAVRGGAQGGSKPGLAPAAGARERGDQWATSVGTR